VLWDRWRLVSARAPRMRLETLLEAAGDGPELMLDLKGHDPRLAGRVAAAVEQAETGPRITVCSQDWALLGQLTDAPGVRLVHSIGGSRARARFLAADEPVAGVSIHRGLLDTATVRDLRSRTGLILSWPVETVAVARQLAALGVDGLISQAFEPIAAALGERETVPA
jgi:glycerophosphoryl diester phosphodiesterase